MRLYREAEYTEANLSLFKCCEMLGKMEETIYVLSGSEAHLLRIDAYKEVGKGREQDAEALRFASSAHPTGDLLPFLFPA